MSYMRTEWGEADAVLPRRGEVPRKRHIQFRRPDGGLYAEELMGEEGFSSDSSLLYHRHLPTAIVKTEAVDAAGARSLAPNQPLSPRHFRTQRTAAGGDLVRAGALLAGNDDVRISYAAADTARRAVPQLHGRRVRLRRSRPARFESTYGALDVGAGDYVVIPTGTIHRWVPDRRRSTRRWSSRRPGTSGRRSATCRSTASSWSTRPTASATCAARPSR